MDPAQKKLKIRAKAPLRISFAGGGTDVPPYPQLEGGCVLNATINNYAWGSLAPRDDGFINLESVDLGISLSIGRDSKIEFDGKLDLAKAAIIRMEAMNSHGFDVFLRTDAPPGSGLGSSSALVVALVGLIREFKNLALTEYQVAQLAYELERNDLGISGGLQDQYAAAFGGFNFMEFSADRVIVNPLRIKPEVINELEHNLLLCYTGITRSSDGIIKDQSSRLENHDPNTVCALKAQKELAVAMKNCLLQRRLQDFGDLLDSAWQMKKRMSDRITTPHIDEIYDEARKAGAIGGKITGAGGGGYMLFYCHFEKKHRVAEAVRKLGAFPTVFAFEESGMQTWRSDESEVRA
jgi:D-glycero-alpha-D-manno-heptose-7-phosphate kinase